MADILLVEDKDSLRRVLRLTLENAGYTVAEAADARAALNEIANSRHRLVLTDLRMPNGSGLDVLRSARSADADVPVIVMTAFGSIDEAVQAMKDGAHDFLQKPVDSNHLLLLVDRALEQARLRTENILLREEWSRRYGFPRIIGESEVVKRAVAETQRVAQTEATVLLLGESGTGKELFARAVHHLSPRRDQPFVAINCAAIPETLIENELFGHERGAFTGASDRRQGKFELAGGGTVFLDEIGELPLGVQGKLLRAIEEKMIDRIGGRAPVAVDVRVVAATNKDLKTAVDNGQFRGDLFFRLAVFPIEIPPLRERGAFTGASDRRQGKFELAGGGTVFLDEIGELPLGVQGKLLRAIEEKMIDRIGGRAPVAVDVRVVAATNKDLKTAVDNGQFRGDLFFRLAVFPIEIPPLRDRGDDVTLLARHFAAEIGRELRGREAQLSDEAVAALKLHRWPGNVRELENAIERACILSDTLKLEPADLGLGPTATDGPDALQQVDLSGTLSDVAHRVLRIVERRKIQAALVANDGNKSKTAEDLGVSYKTLLNKIKDYTL